jgi:hypothetical protein
MSRLIWIELERPDEASQLTEMLEANGVQADTSRTVRGKPEVHVHKPLLRRMSSFMAEVEPVVRRWLEERAPGIEGVTARTIDERFEIRSPIAHGPRARVEKAAPA